MESNGSWERRALVGLVVALHGCADITPIEHGKAYGEVITLKDWFTSSYLLPYSDGAVLFDAGFRVGTMEKLLAEQGVAPASVTHVFVTHGHGDHIGALSLFSNAEIVGMEDERALVEDESEGMHTLDVGLTGDELFQFDEVLVEVIPMPGHTSGNAVYRVGNTVLLGDSALVTRDGKIQPVAEKRSDDPAGAIESLNELSITLSDQAIDWLVPSHSAGISGIGALTEFAESN